MRQMSYARPTAVAVSWRRASGGDHDAHTLAILLTSLTLAMMSLGGFAAAAVAGHIHALAASAPP